MSPDCRSLRFLKLTLTAVLTAPLLAHAGNGVIQTRVTALSPSVTYASGSLVTYMGFEVVVRNAGGNTVNNILFTGAITDTSGSADTAFTEKATFDSAEGV